MSKPREPLYPSLLEKSLAENRDIMRVAARHTAWMPAIDPKDEIAAITATGRRRRRPGERVKIINPFGTLTVLSTGCNPLAPLDPEPSLPAQAADKDKGE
jgi:type IV secretory pathway TraG/TraD family ATPase VirD4